LLAQSRKRSQQLFSGLKKLQKQHGVIREIRGRGLMVGIELTLPGATVVQEAAKRGLLFNCTQEKVLRMYPALTISEKELAQGLRILDQSLAAATRKALR
jgi:acetylornithine/succinyldiaminopimelate/putrescine aminotransferase